MKIKQIILSITAPGEYEKYHSGKEVFLSATAVPDTEAWTLEEAELNYFELGKKLSQTSQLQLLARGMISKENYLASAKRISDGYNAIIEKLKGKLDNGNK